MDRRVIEVEEERSPSEVRRVEEEEISPSVDRRVVEEERSPSMDRRVWMASSWVTSLEVVW